MAETGMKYTFPEIFEETVSKFGNRDAYAFVGEKPITYADAYKRINGMIAFLEKAGIKQGDKVALLSSNMPNWGICYFGVTFMGAIIVPILPDFSVTEITNVINHSESKMVFVSSNLLYKIDKSQLTNISTVVCTNDFSVISSDVENLSYDPEAKPSKKYEVKDDDIASIVYTSGTTGRSKGVMLSHKNICFNAYKGRMLQFVNENDRYLSILPLSHTYENTLGLILSLIGGACTYYLKKPPTPSILLPALAEVRPTTILSVPLIIEKIYYGKIVPTFEKNAFIKTLYKISIFRKIFNRIAGKKLKETFGGQMRFFGVGGAKLNTTIERFLKEAGFPYAIGYGLTETAPLIAGTSPYKTIIDSTGPHIDGIELKINDPDKNGEGEVWVKGPCVMQGYYKEPELTAQVMSDGWFRTGDLASLDRKGNVFIKGRLKTMIIGSSGENIYPEEIESVINNCRFVEESLVVEKKGKLVAMVHINIDEFEKKYAFLKDNLSNRFDEKMEELKREIMDYVNMHVSKYCRIYKVELQTIPFQKTATHKIKRFLYT